MQRTQHMTGSMGLHYVCFRLSEYGWNVLVSKEKVTDPNQGSCWWKDGKSITFQTQSQGRKSAIQLNGGLSKIAKQFLIAVVNLDFGEPEVYIFTADEARTKMIEQGKPVRGFIEVRDYDTDEFRDRWDKLDK